MPDPTPPAPAPAPGREPVSQPYKLPEPGSAAALATWLQGHSDACLELGRPDWVHMANRAATLLQQQAAPAVVPVVFDAGDGITIHRTRQAPDAWAVRRDMDCLAVDGAWSYEPMPSNRTEAWLARHRFASAEAAAHAIPLPQGGEGEV